MVTQGLPPKPSVSGFGGKRRSKEAVGLLIWLFTIRCPECGAHLPSFPGEYCKYCGNRLDWDKPPRF